MLGVYSADDDCSEDLWELESEEAAEVVISEGSAGVLQLWLAAQGACVTQLSIQAPKVEDRWPPEALMLQLPFGQLLQLHSFICCNAQLQELQLGSDSTIATCMYIDLLPDTSYVGMGRQGGGRADLKYWRACAFQCRYISCTAWHGNLMICCKGLQSEPTQRSTNGFAHLKLKS
jgi:hypothetical protein